MFYFGILIFVALLVVAGYLVLTKKQAENAAANGNTSTSNANTVSESNENSQTSTSTASTITSSPNSEQARDLTARFGNLSEYVRLAPSQFYTFNGLTPTEKLTAEVNFKAKTPTAVAELYLANYVADQVQKSIWSGNRKEEWPAGSIKVEAAFLNELKAIEAGRSQKLTIPANELTLYTSQDSKTEIQSDILAAYDEFVAFLKYRGIADKYIQEFTNNAQPRDSKRLIYQSNTSADAPPTVNERYSGANGDYSQRQITFYPVDIYNRTRSITLSGLFTGDNKLVRRFATKFLTYHELTHSLQRAVDTANVSADKRSLKSVYVYADISLRKFNSPYLQNWGGESEDLIQNADLNSEGQADGIAFEIASATFGLSQSQQRLFWEFEFESLKEGAALYQRLFATFGDKYPAFYMADFGSNILASVVNKMTASEDTRLLSRLSYRLAGLGAYGGYLRPLGPTETKQIWEYIKK